MEQKGSTNIQVAIRIRPLIAIENEKKLRPQWATQNNIIYQIDENGQKFGELYSFDHIFEMNKTNSEIYDDIVKDFIVSSLDGLNSTIFAYGQTSSGKTYTMLGDKKETGVMSLAIENIFNIIQNNSTRKYLLRVSYMEIYNEKINDLLDPSNKDVKIREFFPATIGLQNIKEEIVSNKEQMYDCLKRGNLNRHIGSTKANERSSRSHTIFKIMIESTQVSEFNDSGGSVQVSNLNLVDLAGSERVAQTKATGMRLKEGGHINKSLSALGLVIRQLSDGQEFVNFRDSKLTRLLQDSLGGNSKTLIIATITLASIEDTCSTLAFAQRAKAVKNKPQVNEILTDADVSKRYAALNTQLQRKLEEQLIINQNLQQTHEENIREMTRLQQQMEMLEDFQGKRVPKVTKTPKRRHTIGFAASKQLFSSFPQTNFERDDEDLQNITAFEDLLTNHTFPRETSRSVGSLETIMEEDVATSNDKLSTPENLLRTRLDALQEEYNELVTYTRDENNILNETIKKAEKLEMQLKSAQKKLSECQNDQKIERELLEDKFKKREQDLCMRIVELEEQLQKKTNKFELDLYNGTISHIMDQLIYLEDILNSSNFVNDLEDAQEEDSVLQIIEKFNIKVKTSKDIIEKEILKQTNNFDHSSQDEIILPNELASFNDLLNELSLFETDIPVALINNMKKDGVEDLKILIKVYESLLRKNELIGRCSEKIRFLEDQRIKNEINNNSAVKQEIENKVKENQGLLEEIKRLNSIIEGYKIEMDDLKMNVDKTMLELTEKNRLISELETSYALLKQESEMLREDFSSLNTKYADLKNENERVKLDNEAYSKQLEDYQSQITNMSSEKLEREETYESVKQELESKMKENHDLLKQMEYLKNTAETQKAELDDLKMNVDKLTQEIAEKEQIICKLEDNCAIFKQQNELFKEEVSIINSKNASLKNEIDLIKSENESQCNKCEVFQIQINNLSSEILEKNKQITDLENSSIGLTQKIDKLNKEYGDICQEKIVLTEENAKLLEKNEFCEKELNELKNRINKLNLEIVDKDNIITRDSALFKQEKDKLLQQLTNYDKDKESLLEKIEQLNTIVESQNKRLGELTSDMMDKNKILDEVEKNYSLLKEEKEKLNKEFSGIYSENQLLKREVEKTKGDEDSCNKRISNFQNEIAKLNSELLRKSTYISELEKNCITLKQEIERLENESFKILAENKSLKNDAVLNDNLSLQISEQQKIISEIQRVNSDLKVELENVTQKLENISSEKEHLKMEIEKLKNVEQNCRKNNSVNEQRNYQYDLKIQRMKQSLKVAQTEVSDLKLAVKEKEKLKCEISQYKGQLLCSDIRQKELTEINEQLRAQINELQGKISQTSEKNSSLNVEKQEESVNEFRFMKEKFEDVLCSIIEQFINEQKTLLLNRHSQDERDYFKSILKDLKSSNVTLKNQLICLRNRRDYDLSAITTSLLKSLIGLREYSNSEKCLKQKQIDQLDASNKAYLQEIMAIKEAQPNADVKIACPQCKSLKMELSELRLVSKGQEEMLNSLKNKNLLLGKENVDRMQQIVDLQMKIYKEKDRKTDVQYTNFLQFCKENDEMQRQQIQDLQRKIEEYQNAAARNKQSVEVQCDIVPLQEKYNALKNICINRKQKMAALQSENVKLKSNLGIKLEDEKTIENDVPVQTTSVEVQCDIIDMEKYALVKKICQQRREQIVALQTQLTALKAGSR